MNIKNLIDLDKYKCSVGGAVWVCTNTCVYNPKPKKFNYKTPTGEEIFIDTIFNAEGIPNVDFSTGYTYPIGNVNDLQVVNAYEIRDTLIKMHLYAKDDINGRLYNVIHLPLVNLKHGKYKLTGLLYTSLHKANISIGVSGLVDDDVNTKEYTFSLSGVSSKQRYNVMDHQHVDIEFNIPQLPLKDIFQWKRMKAKRRLSFMLGNFTRYSQDDDGKAKLMDHVVGLEKIKITKIK